MTSGHLNLLDIVFEFHAHILSRVDTPVLLFLNDVDALGLDVRTGESSSGRSLWYKEDRKSQSCDDAGRILLQ